MRQVKSGMGWRLGRDPAAPFPGLVGTEEWAIELTAAELQDFCRLTRQLAETMAAMQSELMAEERISCEAESDLLWMEAEGFPHTFRLRLIVLTGRKAEGEWAEDAVPDLVQATQMWTLF